MTRSHCKDSLLADHEPSESKSRRVIRRCPSIVVDQQTTVVRISCDLLIEQTTLHIQQSRRHRRSTVQPPVPPDSQSHVRRRTTARISSSREHSRYSHGARSTESREQRSAVLHRKSLLNESSRLTIGIAYVKYEKASAAARAMEEMNGTVIPPHIRPVKVRSDDRHRPMPPSPILGDHLELTSRRQRP